MWIQRVETIAGVAASGASLSVPVPVLVPACVASGVEVLLGVGGRSWAWMWRSR